MMEINEILASALDNAFSLGLLVGAVFWFKKRDEKKDETINELNKELRETLERNINKTNDALTNNTLALNGLTEALKK